MIENFVIMYLLFIIVNIISISDKKVLFVVGN